MYDFEFTTMTIPRPVPRQEYLYSGWLGVQTVVNDFLNGAADANDAASSTS